MWIMSLWMRSSLSREQWSKLKCHSASLGPTSKLHSCCPQVHERSLESDFLLMVLRDLTQRRSGLKIVLMRPYSHSVPNLSRLALSESYLQRNARLDAVFRLFRRPGALCQVSRKERLKR